MQIFSNAVADGLRLYQQKVPGFENCNATLLLTKRFNDLFDSLNRRFPAEGIRINGTDIEVVQIMYIFSQNSHRI